VRVRNADGHVAEAVRWVVFAKAPPGCGCELGAAAATTRPFAGALLVVLLALRLRYSRRRPSEGR